MIEWLKRNRILLLTTLLVSSWASLLLAEWAREVLTLSCVMLLLVCLYRVLSENRSDTIQTDLAGTEKVLLGLLTATMLGVLIYAYGFDGDIDTAPITFSLLAAIHLPHQRQDKPIQETTGNA